MARRVLHDSEVLMTASAPSDPLEDIEDRAPDPGIFIFPLGFVVVSLEFFSPRPGSSDARIEVLVPFVASLHM